jgi:hypothetical protein
MVFLRILLLISATATKMITARRPTIKLIRVAGKSPEIVNPDFSFLVLCQMFKVKLFD